MQVAKTGGRPARVWTEKENALILANHRFVPLKRLAQALQTEYLTLKKQIDALGLPEPDSPRRMPKGMEGFAMMPDDLIIEEHAHATHYRIPSMGRFFRVNKPDPDEV